MTYRNYPAHYANRLRGLYLFTAIPGNIYTGNQGKPPDWRLIKHANIDVKDQSVTFTTPDGESSRWPLKTGVVCTKTGEQGTLFEEQK